MSLLEQTTEKVSAAEYLRLLKADQLFPLNDDKRLEAVRLAKLYSGRVVIKEWKAWRRSETAGFLVFAKALPERIRQEEKNRMQEERKNHECTADTVPQAEVTKLFDDFRKQHRIPPKAQGVSVEPVPEPRLASDGLPPPKVGYIDPVLGWCVGGMPVF